MSLECTVARRRYRKANLVAVVVEDPSSDVGLSCNCGHFPILVRSACGTGYSVFLLLGTLRNALASCIQILINDIEAKLKAVPPLEAVRVLAALDLDTGAVLAVLLRRVGYRF